MTDIWVCGSCHSINRQRSNRCYKCGSEQKTVATDEGVMHRQEQAIAMRTVVAYRSSAALALATSIFLLCIVVVTLAEINLELGLGRFVAAQLATLNATGTVDEAANSAAFVDADRLQLIALGVAVPALLFFAAWLSRVVANVPALGGGIPGTNPGRAFVSTLIPILNLKAVPGILQDVLYRLDPRAGGIFMIGVAWLGLVGSWIFSYLASRYVALRVTSDIANARSLDDALESLRGLLTAALVIDVITALMITIGTLVLIMLIVRIERRSRTRDREVRALAGV